MAAEIKDHAAELEKRAIQLKYVSPQVVTDAQAALTDVSQNRPQEYSAEDAHMLQSLRDRIANREAYAYDPSKDETYAQYRKAYEQMMRQGALMAQESAQKINGGYGSSWSAQAAGQMYGAGIQTADDAVEQYERNAYAGYRADEQNDFAKLGIAAEKDSSDYQRNADEYSRWYSNRSYAAGRAVQTYGREFQLFGDNVSGALTMLGYGREDAETVRSNAYTLAMELLKKGVMPIDAVLENAGISKNDARRLAKKKG